MSETERLKILLAEALRHIRAVHTDIEAMRDNGEDYFGQFTVYRADDMDVVSVEWPNLSLLSDGLGTFLNSPAIRQFVDTTVLGHGAGEMIGVGRVEEIKP